MFKADFYIASGPFSRWIGSSYINGDPVSIPYEILLSSNKVEFEENVIEFLKKRKSAISSNDDQWPWLWEDSQGTDFSYIFFLEFNKVFASELGGSLFDPIVIKKGGELLEADAYFGPPMFPIMGSKHGQKCSKTL
jgi:hypothetical protein